MKRVYLGVMLSGLTSLCTAITVNFADDLLESSDGLMQPAQLECDEQDWANLLKFRTIMNLMDDNSSEEGEEKNHIFIGYITKASCQTLLSIFRLIDDDKDDSLTEFENLLKNLSDEDYFNLIRAFNYLNGPAHILQLVLSDCLDRFFQVDSILQESNKTNCFPDDIMNILVEHNRLSKQETYLLLQLPQTVTCELIGAPYSSHGSITCDNSRLALEKPDNGMWILKNYENSAQVEKELDYSAESTVFTPDGKYLVQAEKDKKIKIIDSSTNEILCKLDADSHQLGATLAFDLDSTVLATATSSKYRNVVQIWDIALEQKNIEFNPRAEVMALELNAQVDKIALACTRNSLGYISLWALTTLKRLAKSKMKTTNLSALNFNHNETSIYSLGIGLDESPDKERLNCYFFDADTLNKQRKITIARVKSPIICSTNLTRDDAFLIVAYENHLGVWHVESGVQLNKLNFDAKISIQIFHNLSDLKLVSVVKEDAESYPHTQKISLIDKEQVSGLQTNQHLMLSLAGSLAMRNEKLEISQESCFKEPFEALPAVIKNFLISRELVTLKLND